ARLGRLAGLASSAALLAGLATGIASRRWLDVVEVRGGSMLPVLAPGDRLLVESRTFGLRLPRPGEVVLAADPRQPARELIKRVVAVDPERRTVELRGDAPEASTDSRSFGAVPIDRVRWRVVARYWPASRAGRLDPELSSRPSGDR
ncbi:MAG TPA: nickel-type superoxide dismutase maturation protease, partial [Candidatus Limnocylindria bacterium]|nr:nickel-type superoxide dismutase maturation protease [Candidatus Limnocylindria bacterium]